MKAHSADFDQNAPARSAARTSKKYFLKRFDIFLQKHYYNAIIKKECVYMAPYESSQDWSVIP